MFFKTIFVLVLTVSLPGLKAQSGEAPCDIDDLPCIREYFAANSNCHPRIFGRVPNQLTANDFRFQVPYFNASHNDQTLIVRNVDQCTVRIIYRNDTVRTTVFGINCENLHVEAERAFILKNLGQIDRVHVIRVVADYDNVALSMNLHGNSLDICRETAYAWTSTPTLFLQGRDRGGVEFTRNDPREMFGRRLNTWIREIWAARATPLFEAWVRNMVCDFKCHWSRFL